MPEIKIKRLPLYRYEDLYGITIWRSILANRIAGNKAQNLMINRIIGLKYHGKYKSFFRDVIRSVRKYFDVDEIAVIPPHKKGLSHLQELTSNAVFVRRKEIAARKYHRIEDDIETEKTLDINLKGFKKDDRVLLLDDVITTGATIRKYGVLLNDFEVIKFAFAINHKLKPRKITEIKIEKEKFDPSDYDYEIKLEDVEIDMDYDLDFDIDL